VYLIVDGLAPLRTALGWYFAQAQDVYGFPPALLVVVAGTASLAGGVALIGLTFATVAPRRLRGWIANLLMVLAVYLTVACLLRFGPVDPRSWLCLWLPALILVRLRLQLHVEPSGRRAFWTALALGAVLGLAPFAAWLTYHQIAVPSKGELVQTSVSPGGRWQIRTYAHSDVGMGPR
jgi:hypothetical protein